MTLRYTSGVRERKSALIVINVHVLVISYRLKVLLVYISLFHHILIFQQKVTDLCFSILYFIISLAC